jgi:hypothetical protein
MTGQPHRITWFHPDRPVEGATIYVRQGRSRTQLVDAGLMGPGCGNPTCPCETHPPQQPCQEWMGWSDYPLPGCPRCGWVKEQHP